MPEEYVPYPHQPVREIDFGVISEGFNIIWKNLGPFVLCALGAIIALYAFMFIGSFAAIPLVGRVDPSATPDMNAILSMQLKSMVIQMPFTFLGYALLGPFGLSMCMMTMKHIRGEKIEVGDIGLGFTKFGVAFLASLLVWLSVTVGSYLCCIPGLIAGGLFMFTFPLIGDRNMQAVEAMKESWRMLVPHMWMGLLFYFVVQLVASLGVIACGIGLFVTFPLSFVCYTLIYRDFTVGRPIPGYTPPPAAPEGM